MKLDLTNGIVSKKECENKELCEKVKEYHKILHSGDYSMGTTWVDWPNNFDKAEFEKVKELSKKIKAESDVLLVVGIGGSYLGAKAGIDVLSKNQGLEIIFAGINFYYEDLASKLEKIKDKNVTVNVVSKSGTTVEILSALNIIEKFMKNKYKEEYKQRMIFTTDKEVGYLRKRANAEGIQTLTVPTNMGGRFSVLSSVGMLPFACAGLDIDAIISGAKSAYKELLVDDIKNNFAYKYSAYRYLINKTLDKKIELFATFNTKMASFSAWLQQLFAESEGKEGKGLYVCPVTFSTDLHSVGQFIQQGSSIIAETFINVQKTKQNSVLSEISSDSPIKFLEGKTFNDINDAAFKGTVKAHIEAKVPVAIFNIEEINEFNFGYMVYYFEVACAMSGFLLGVNPFDQPGVEQYKAQMKQLLKR